MGKLFGILLVVLAIYLGITVYEKGVDGAFGGVLAGSKKSATQRPAADEERDPSAFDQSPSSARPGAVTERVRERVTGAMEQGARRSSGR